MTAADAASAPASNEVTPNSTPRSTRSAAAVSRTPSDDPAGQQPPGGSGDQPDHFARRGTDREPDRNLARPIRHDQHEQAVEADAGKGERRARKRAQHRRIELRLIERTVDDVSERTQPEDGALRIDPVDDLPQIGGKRPRVGGAHDVLGIRPPAWRAAGRRRTAPGSRPVRLPPWFRGCRRSCRSRRNRSAPSRACGRRGSGSGACMSTKRWLTITERDLSSIRNGGQQRPGHQRRTNRAQIAFGHRAACRRSCVPSAFGPVSPATRTE